jgi:hypothetical protein
MDYLIRSDPARRAERLRLRIEDLGWIAVGSDVVRERVADELFFVVPVTPVLFCDGALPLALVEDEFSELIEIA